MTTRTDPVGIAKPDTEPAPAYILVVDDHPLLAQATASLVKALGYPVEVCHSGAQAIERIGHSRPEALLLDALMPEMDGFDVIAALRGDPHTASLPILMVTGLSEPADRIRALQAGADDWLSKPVHPLELRLRLQNILRKQSEKKRLHQEALHFQQEAHQAMESLRTRSTELARMQIELQHHDRLSAIGKLSAGIAHEINNPLAFVKANVSAMAHLLQKALGTLQALKASGQADPAAASQAAASQAAASQPAAVDWEAMALDEMMAEAAELQSETQEGVARMIAIVKDLRDFARKDSPQAPQSEDVLQALKLAMNIAKPQIKGHVRVVEELQALPPIEHWRGPLSQVFLNLIMNALQAMKDSPDASLILRSGEDASRDMYWVEIQDTGPGVAPELQERIFEPFFSTKGPSEGTGLGLSLSYGIVQMHGGDLSLWSPPGQGATFRVSLHRNVPKVPEPQP